MFRCFKDFVIHKKCFKNGEETWKFYAILTKV